MNTELLKAIPGGADLIAWFDGQAPRFHDAEVVGIAFDRSGPTCMLRVHGFKVAGTRPDGRYFFDDHVLVTFQLDGVTAMQIDDFNHQNALMGLSITRGSDEGFRVELDPAHGLSGFVEARSLEIRLAPGIPAGSQYAGLDDAR